MLVLFLIYYKTYYEVGDYFMVMKMYGWIGIERMDRLIHIISYNKLLRYVEMVFLQNRFD
jgi:hypothetical protein